MKTISLPPCEVEGEPLSNEELKSIIGGTSRNYQFCICIYKIGSATCSCDCDLESCSCCSYGSVEINVAGEGEQACAIECEEHCLNTSGIHDCKYSYSSGTAPITPSPDLPTKS